MSQCVTVTVNPHTQAPGSLILPPFLIVSVDHRRHSRFSTFARSINLALTCKSVAFTCRTSLLRGPFVRILSHTHHHEINGKKVGLTLRVSDRRVISIGPHQRLLSTLPMATDMHSSLSGRGSSSVSYALTVGKCR